jgi:hypothetical protein
MCDQCYSVLCKGCALTDQEMTHLMGFSQGEVHLIKKAERSAMIRTTRTVVLRLPSTKTVVVQGINTK